MTLRKGPGLRFLLGAPVQTYFVERSPNARATRAAKPEAMGDGAIEERR